MSEGGAAFEWREQLLLPHFAHVLERLEALLATAQVHPEEVHRWYILQREMLLDLHQVLTSCYVLVVKMLLMKAVQTCNEDVGLESCQRA